METDTQQTKIDFSNIPVPRPDSLPIETEPGPATKRRKTTHGSDSDKGYVCREWTNSPEDCIFDNEFAADLFPWLQNKNVNPLGRTGYFDIFIFECENRILAYDTEMDFVCYLGSTIKEAEYALKNFQFVKIRILDENTGEETDRLAWNYSHRQNTQREV